MRFRYLPENGVRRMGEVVWNQENGYTAEVTDVELAAQLVTYPREQFGLVEISDKERKALEKSLGGEVEVVDVPEEPEEAEGLEAGE